MELFTLVFWLQRWFSCQSDTWEHLDLYIWVSLLLWRVNSAMNFACGGFLQNMGTPSHHPFLDGIFRYKPSSYWASPMTSWTPPCGPAAQIQDFCKVRDCRSPQPCTNQSHQSEPFFVGRRSPLMLSNSQVGLVVLNHEFDIKLGCLARYPVVKDNSVIGRNANKQLGRSIY